MSDVHTVHNPEKLKFSASAYVPNTYRIGIDGGDWLMAVLHNGEQVEARQIANVRRLVACWNACQGSSTDWLEFQNDKDKVDQFGLPEPFQTRFINELQRGVKAMEQRENLLSALRLLLNSDKNIAEATDADLESALENSQEIVRVMANAVLVARAAIREVTGVHHEDDIQH